MTRCLFEVYSICSICCKQLLDYFHPSDVSDQAKSTQVTGCILSLFLSLIVRRNLVNDVLKIVVNYKFAEGKGPRLTDQRRSLAPENGKNFSLNSVLKRNWIVTRAVAVSTLSPLLKI